MSSHETKYHVLSVAPSLKRNGLLQALTSDPHFKLKQPTTPDEALRLAGTGQFDLILVDDEPGWVSLPELIIRTKGIDPDIPILVFRDARSEVEIDQVWGIGIEDCLLQPVTPAELLHHVARALKSRRLGLRCEELTQENKQLYQLAITDGLTRLVNRRHFMERLEAEFARIIRFGGRIGAAICDIDHFKVVNDTYGHATGDKVLKHVSAIINKSVRSIDTAGRYGGEEFVLLLPETSSEGVMRLSEKLRLAVEEFNFSDDGTGEPGPEHLTISIGGASYPETHVMTPQELLELADKALYRAKLEGRNRVEMN